MYWKEGCYFNRSLEIEVLCFYCCSCRISLTKHVTENYARNYPLRSPMVMLKYQISQVRCPVETILLECSENTSLFHHFLYNKGLFYKTVKLNSALMCPLAAAGACLLETGRPRSNLTHEVWGTKTYVLKNEQHKVGGTRW